MDDPDTPTTQAASAAASAPQFDPALVVSHLHGVGASLFEATPSEIALALSGVPDAFEKCRKFANEAGVPTLVVVKERVPQENDAVVVDDPDQPAPEVTKFDLRLDVHYSANLVSSIVFIKRAPVLDPAKPMSSQVTFIHLPGPAAGFASGGPVDAAAPTMFYELIHSYVHHAVAPYFNAFVNSQAATDADAKDAANAANGSVGNSTSSLGQPLLSAVAAKRAAEDTKGIPVAKKKFAELELSLLHLQQNVDIPEVTLHAHPVIHQAIAAARDAGRRPNVDLIPPELLADSSFLNKLQGDVNSWVKEIQKVTKLSRDPASGTASQEINFWLNMERALEKIDKQLKSEEVLLVLDVLKHAKRFHATVSFRADTGLQEGMDVVHKYNILMKEFPIDELLAATDLGRINEALVLVFNHINKKIKLSSYPVKRHLLLVEAISRDLLDQILKVLKARRLMYLSYDDFNKVTAGCAAVFDTWDSCIKDFSGLAREVSRKRNDKYLPIKITNFHAKLQERIEYMRRFRKQHEQLQATIGRVVGSPSHLAPGMRPRPAIAAAPGSAAAVGAAAAAAADINALDEVASAYEVVRTVDVLDVTGEGTEIWAGAEEAYNERVGRVENIIIATLRDKLGSAKNANEMFRVFSKFNALFVRPKIRGAIQEYQTQLIDSVKDDLRKLQDKFKLQYPSSEAFHMSGVRDIPPVAGAITWARQIERQLDMYMRHVEDVLGRGWENYADGARLAQDSVSFRKKLDTRAIYEQWVQEILQRDLKVTGRIFDVVRQRANNNQLQLVVSFDPQIITLFKEVRNMQWLGYSIPSTVANIAKEAKRVYPFAVSMQETIRTYQLTVDKLRSQPRDVALLVAVYQRDVQGLIARGIHYRWEVFSTLDVRSDGSKHVGFVRELANTVSLFQDKVVNVMDVMAHINAKVRELEKCAYAFPTFEAILGDIQAHVDKLNLDGYSNLNVFVDHLDKQLELVLVKRLTTAMNQWARAFEATHDDDYATAAGGSGAAAAARRKRHSMLRNASSSAAASVVDGGEDAASVVDDADASAEAGLGGADVVKPKLNPLVHEVTIRNQIMYIDPPLERARATWYHQLQQWMATVCNQSRIQSTHYQLSMRQAEKVTYGSLLERLPETSLRAVYSIIEAKMAQVEAYVEVWLQYQSLWDLEPSTVYEALGDDLAKWQGILLEIKKARGTFDVSDTAKLFGPIVIDYEQVQSKVNAKYDQWQREILTKYGAKLAQAMRDFHATIAKARGDLEAFSVDSAATGDTVAFIIFLQDLKRKVVPWSGDVDAFRSGQKVLERQRYSFPADWIYIEQIDGEWSAFNEILIRKDNSIQEQVSGLQLKIVQQDKAVQAKCASLMDEWDKTKPVQGDIPAEHALNTLSIYEAKLTRIRDEVQQLAKAKEALGLVDSGRDTASLDVALEEMADLKAVWSALSSVWAELSELRELPWANVSARKVRSQLDALVAQTREMPAKMRQYAAFEYMQDTLKGLVRMNGLLSELKSEALRDRHWKALLKQLNVHLLLTDLTLGHVWTLDLRRNEQVIRTVITTAQGEMALEEYLRQVKETWTNYSLELVNYQNKCRLVKGWDDLFSVCSEHLNSLQAMRMSPYYRVFEEEAGSWEDKLNRVQLLFDVWIDVQRQWVYLEGVFTGSADIKHLLPVETSRFQNINTEFMAVMKKVYKSPYVLDVLNIQNIQKSMERLADLLTKIQKALGEYLERERSAFPRFYFVGDEDLLEIIGNAKDVERVQKHLKKMFAGISTVTTGNDGEITAIKSKEGETVPFRTPVPVKDRRINEWLTGVEREMKTSLALILEDCHAEYAAIFHGQQQQAAGADAAAVATTSAQLAAALLAWMAKFPSQLIVLASQIVWTESVEACLAQDQPAGPTLGLVETVLQVLADAVLTDLDLMTRKKCEHLVTELVHQRDVIRTLLKNGIARATDFEWLYYMRFYLDPKAANPLQRLEVRMANAKFYYGYEYLGIPDRLVQTPLTDRCFLTLTQALEARLGGSPFGPAGTGKTESVKALGVALGRFVLVFCCDENFDFQAMGRIFVGLCMVGAWGCFDEFNRLEERILSAVSQQVQSIQLGLRKVGAALKQNPAAATAFEIELLGRQVPINADTGIFITMNPGYAGRSNLPDNLKKLFRSVAMTKPDRELIAQVMLYSQGFKSAETLATKVVPLFNLCSEQLSSQSHYDFGLRALKSVLVSAGNLKRMRIVSGDAAAAGAVVDSELSSPITEQEILIQSVCETVMPKLVIDDLPLLKSLLQDVFPGIEYKPVDLGKLEDAIRAVCKERYLECTDAWMAKILQLYQIQHIHHGLMMVGPSGTGKSANWKVLLEALERVENVEGVSYVIDPKAIPKDNLYGTLDATTREWTDGLFTHILRKIIDNVRGESGKRHWIIFDGDVDPEWVENLNSVLDDNKLLTLPNGERLSLPPNVRILFEVDTLKYATLATVSRCGMVWYSEEVVTPEMMCAHYLNTLAAEPLDMGEEAAVALPQEDVLNLQRSVVSALAPHMEKDGFVLRALKHAETDIEHIMDFTAGRVINTLFSLINKAIRNMIEYDAQHTDFPLSLSAIEAYTSKKLLTAVVWSFSGDAKLDARKDLSDFVHGITTIDLPFSGDGNVIDYDVTLPTGEWINWTSRVPQIEIETHNVSQADVVVPTVDTVRHEQVLYSWLSEHKPVLLCGPPGSGKTMTLFSALRKLPDMEVVGLNFSSATTPDLVLKTLEQYCEYKKTPSGLVMCPQTLGKWLVIFCDEINLPATDSYGTQKVLSFLRQMIESNGFWRTSDLQWIKLERIQFVGACNPPTDPGRVPMSHRFLRHAPLVMVDYPGRTSLIQIYSTFARALLKVIPTLRGYADALTNAMVDFYLDSQQRFTPDIQAHYVYSPRELTRWVRGIYEAIYPLDDLSVDGLVRVWAHEALRLFQDRLVAEDEREWTDQQLDEVAFTHFPSLDPAALQRPILFSNWLTKNYLPVQRDSLRDFVKARLRVFYEEELDVPLVLFNHVLEHVLRIDRVFRQMQGHLLLIGVSGSGKTTLSRFVAWMNGFSVFQIKAHNKYTGDDFDEDLRHVLRRAGCKGEKICFIMDESNVLDSGFLERMNTLLANAEVPGLFEGDEYAALMNQCKEAAAKEGLLLDSSEELYKWFTRQVMKNLHVVFTMNPPENGLASRAATSPALFNRCVLDWFGDWNDEAFYQVGKEFTDVLDLDVPNFNAPDTMPVAVRDLVLPPTYRDAVLNAFVHVHQSVHHTNQRLAKRQGRYNYCTPRHYLDFIRHYVRLFNEKREELEEQQRHLNVGLDKLNDTVKQVEELRGSLAIKKYELERKDQLANEKLKRMVAEQNEAEKKKSASQEMSKMLESQTLDIQQRREVVMADLAEAEPAVQEAQRSVQGIKKQQLTEVRSMGNPPEAVKMAMESVCTLLGHQIDSWKSVQAVIRREDFIASIINFDTDSMMTPALRERMKRDYLSKPNYHFEVVNRASKACGPLVQWVIAQVKFSEILVKVGPLRNEVQHLEESAERTRIEAQKMEQLVRDLEVSIARYKEEYAELISETQMLKAEMERVKHKVDRSVSLIASLSSEKVRWEETSQTFELQMATLVGDVLLSAAYLAYGGYFDQQYRGNLWSSWRGHLRLSGISFKSDLALIETLCTADQRLNWHANALPTDDLCIENAIMIERHNRYPLIIDPSGQATAFIANEYKDRKIMVTSFLDDSFLKNLESALRFGNPILIQDVENLDPILNPVLNRELRRTGGRVLIRLGNQDIDFSPSFTLFLATRDPSVNFPPDICSRVTFVNFTVTKSSLQTQCLNKVLSQERPDVDEKRTDLLKLQGEFSFRLRQLEKSLLQALNESKGNILDDDHVIATLEVLKKEAAEVQQKVLETDAVMKEIDTVTAMYTPFSSACASIFFAMEQLSHIHHFYQFSLEFFNEVFQFVLKSAKLAAVRDYNARLDVLILELFKESFRRVSRALVHDDHVMFATILAQIYLSLEARHLVLSSEFEYLVTGVAPPLKGNSVAAPDFQARLEQIAALDSFRTTVFPHVQANGTQWEAFLQFRSQAIPECWSPNGHAIVAHINRTIVAKAFRPDLVPASIEQLIHAVFENEFPLSYETNLGKIVQEEVHALSPVAFCAQPGLDASNRVENLAQDMGVALQSVAMGSAEGYGLADKAISNAVQRGGWVLLKNVHLAPQWLSQLEKRLHSLRPHAAFRLFLTMETNPRVPVNLLRQSRIFMFEAPPGIKANLLDSLNSIKSMPALTRGPAEKARLYFLVSWLHALLQERLRYAPLGWSKVYEFNDADMECALFTLDEWCEKAAGGRSNLSPAKIPWAAIKTLIKESVYGGKIDVEFDQYVLNSFVDQLIVPQAYELDFPLVHGHLAIPEGTRIEHFIEWAQRLPEREPPKWLGLPENAEKVILAHHGTKLLAQIQKMRSLEDDSEEDVSPVATRAATPVTTTASAADGGLSHHAHHSSASSSSKATAVPAWMKALHASVDEWTKLLPASLTAFAHPNVNDPMARFFLREHAMARKLLAKLKQDLHHLKLVCEGHMKQTNHLRSLMSALTKGVIPKEWRAYKVPRSWQVRAWLDDLVRRLEQLNQLAALSSYDGGVHVWLGGLFMPEAFITATRQAFAQRNGWSLEELELDLDLSGASSSPATPAADHGFTLTGLRLESAAWVDGVISLSSTMHSSLGPAVLRWVKAGAASDTKTPMAAGAREAPIPVYLNEDRFSMLFSVQLPTRESARELLQNGAAMLTM
ncbi:dynein heavy chain [Blastocladiella emersonii ATCC 22665]|nr:dynein heavy chain [Blastocladiella emersonii ATCC 22665]